MDKLEHQAQKQREATARWRKRHPEKARESSRTQHKIHYQRDRAQNIIYRSTHPDKTKKWDRNKIVKLKHTVISHYGAKCACCGEEMIDFLCIDHIDGGGRQHRKITGVGTHFYQWLKRNNYPIGFQVLCYNCNHAKELVLGCPHKYSDKKEVLLNLWGNTTPTKKRQARRYREEIKIKVTNHYGGKCNCCGENEISFLCIDHINGGGTQQTLQLEKGGTGFYYYLKQNNFPKGYQVLCHNCNHAKEQPNGCPHQNKGGE